ncbi:MAG: cyclic nucleotide-binding domain-containing protein [Anaerolineae bacterium]|nr:cyclic nucleotide-binding domain-containing protein [Anaerolineae bacterium]
MENIVDFLASVSLFHGLAPDILAQMGSEARVVNLEKGDILFRQGASGRELFIIREGSLKISIETDNRQSFHLADFHTGQVVGELEIIDGMSRAATVQANVRSKLIAIPREAFFAHLGMYPELALHLMRVLSERLRQNNLRQLEAMTHAQPLERRLASLLLLLAENSPSGQVERFDRGQMAQVLNATPNDLQDQLRAWFEEELVAFQDEATLELLDLNRLRSIAGLALVD